MLVTFSFPIVENANLAELRTRIKRINRFFLMKADLSGNSRSFGIECLAPNNVGLKDYLKDDFSDNKNYYLYCKFFNAYKQKQKKLELFVNLGDKKEVIEDMLFEVYSAGNISSLPLKQVIFSYISKESRLKISVEPVKEYETKFRSFLEMLANDFYARSKEHTQKIEQKSQETQN